VQLKVRFADFRTITRSRTLPTPTDLAAEIAATARDLLDRIDVERGIRLLGVSVQQLIESAAAEHQESLALDFEEPGRDPDERIGDRFDDRRAALERSIDGVRRRYGSDSVIPARLAEPPRRD
jgi:DNA polymerase IV